MQYFCDAGELTWFRLETAGEAALESQQMDHAVEKYFKQAYDDAVLTYQPPSGVPAMEQNIGLKEHVERVMPRFLTLRNNEGTALVTAMLPRTGHDEDDMRPIIVGKTNGDPYLDYEVAIDALGRHVDMDLNPQLCFPYRR